MNRGARRRIIPLSVENLESWPAPDQRVLADSVLQRYLPRRQAVEMYSAGLSYTEIRAVAGLSEDEVRRLTKRCVSLHRDGEIFGFRALLPGTRLKDYERIAPVNHVKGGGSGACAGALEQLFGKFPELRAQVQQLYFNEHRSDRLPEACMPITRIHGQFKAALRKLGLGEYDWPFNTENCGYQALWSYCKNLRLENSQHAALSRSGIEAARRGAVGTGEKPLIPCLRLFSFVQLDFHKVDAASIIVIRNDYGVELEVPVTRWHIGLLAEEHSGIVLGCYVTLERTPSADSTLEVLDNALRPEEFDASDPRYSIVKDGKVLLRELMPEFEYQCFSVLKVDNAWSNAAHEVVNGLMDTVGCAVNFGPVRAWWRRCLIERIFEALTQRGLQRLPSTHGKGPGDPRSRDPNIAAIKFRILLSDLIGVIYGCIRDHNTEPNEGFQWGSPLQTVQAALTHPASGLMLQPLPKLKQKSLWLTMHVEEVTVRGSLSRNERPYFVTDRCRYTNEKLAYSPWLIGAKLIIYVDRRRCSIVYASVKETGERLGLMTPPVRWANSKCTWRDRKLFNRSGMATRLSSDGDDPVDVMTRAKVEALQKRARKQRTRSSKEALDLARFTVKTPVKSENARQTEFGKPDKAMLNSDNAVNTTEPNPAMPDPFGLSTVPIITTVKRRS
jgi:hypothetical protein